MQNKGAIRTFAILLAVICLYQLMFTYKTQSVEADMREYAHSMIELRRDSLGSAYDTHQAINDSANIYNRYADSIMADTIPVYNFLGIAKYTYKECKEKEINFGLDLKGGMNLVLEVKVADVLKAISSYNQDPTFNQAISNAEVREQNGDSKDFIDIFYEEFVKLDPNASLAAIFNTPDLKEKVGYNSSNDDVLAVIKEETNSSIDNAFNILSTRIDRFGVVQPNIQRLSRAGRVLVELPGVTDPQRVRKLLQGTANLEFWETYQVSELIQPISEANQLIFDIESAKIKSDVVTDTLALDNDSTALADSLDNSMAKSLFTYLTPNVYQQNGSFVAGSGAMVGMSSPRDTAQVNTYLNTPRIRSLFPQDVRFMWSIKPEPTTGQQAERFGLYAIRVTNPDGRPPLDGGAISSAQAEKSTSGAGFEVSMTMNSEGSNAWSRITGNNVGKSIAIVLDNYVYSAPNVNQQISGGRSSITGNFDAQEAQDLANILKSGKMPAPARIIKDTVVGPELGQESINSGLTSFLWAFLVVLIYMVFFYGVRAGLVADLALLLNMFFIIGVMASFGAVLTLPGIAAIVLTIGMSVDANVLIYERIKEEMALGKGVKLAVKEGYKNAFSAIIDSNITTFLTGFILFIFGTGPIKGFATSLMIGIATSFLTAVFITRLIYERMIERKVDLKFSTKLTQNFLKNTKIKFLEKRNLFFAISGILLLVGIGSLATLGLKSGIDFTGGRIYVVRFDKQVSAEEIRDALDAQYGDADVAVKTYGSDNQVRISTNYMVGSSDVDVDTQVETKLYEGLVPFLSEGTTLDNFLTENRMESDKVEPAIASETMTNAAMSVLFSLIVIFLYILLRFRNWEYGIGAIVALAHDVLIVLGSFSLLYNVMPFNLEINQAFIAAILTVIGYSINDTVVVFDRIREYLGLHPKRDRVEVIDSALNSTMSRTVNTSLTTFVVLLVIFLFGGETIQGFVFALMLGVVVGTYSSLFIATPISVSLMNRKKGKNKK